MKMKRVQEAEGEDKLDQRVGQAVTGNISSSPQTIMILVRIRLDALLRRVSQARLLAQLLSHNVTDIAEKSLNA